MCTFHNPGYRDILNKEQVAAAKSHLIKWMTLSLTQQQPQGEATEEVQSAMADEEESFKKDLNTIRNSYLKTKKLRKVVFKLLPCQKKLK